LGLFEHGQYFTGMRRHTLILFLILALLPVAEVIAANSDSPLVMGVFPRREAGKTRQMFQPLAAHLERSLRRKVQLVVPPDFPSFWKRLKNGDFHVVHYNQYHYIKAHKLFGHRAILMNEEHGRASIRAAILVPADSPVSSIAQLRGAKILFGGSRGAMVSHIMAKDLLRKHGLHEHDYLTSIALNPIAAVNGMFYYQADASSGSDSLLDMPNMPWRNNGKRPRVLAMSKPVAHLPWAVTPEVDQNLAKQIRDSLESLRSQPRGQQILGLAQLTALRPAEDKDYDAHRRIVARTLGEQY